MNHGPVARLIATDLDGTLLGPDGRVSAANLAALQRANAMGIEVVAATGRRHCYAMGPLRELALDRNHALISSNGTVLRTIGADLLHHTFLPLATTRWLVEYCDAFRPSMMLTFDTVQPGGDDTYGALVCEEVHDLRGSIGAWMEANGAYIRYVRQLEDALHDQPPIQMMMCGTLAEMGRAIDHMLRSGRVVTGADQPTAATEIVLHRTEYPQRDLVILDILPAGCSKASALERLTALRGCTAMEVVAVGDNWNDLPMLEYAGTAFVMENAPDELRKLAHIRGWRIAPSNANDGVAWAIDQVLGVSAAETPSAA